MMWADIAILVIVAISVVISLLRGFIREVLSLVAWIVALWVALRFSDQVAPLLEGHVSVPSGRLALAFLALFLGTLFLVGVINFLISKLVESTGLTGTDRVLGMVFGTARGIAVAGVLVLGAGLTPLPQDPWWRESLLLPHLERLALWTTGFFPPEFADNFSYLPTAETP